MTFEALYFAYKALPCLAISVCIRVNVVHTLHTADNSWLGGSFRSTPLREVRTRLQLMHFSQRYKNELIKYSDFYFYFYFLITIIAVVERVVGLTFYYLYVIEIDFHLYIFFMY